MHRVAHEPAPRRVELRVRERDVVGERAAEAGQAPARAVAVELEHVQRELVVPRDVAVRELFDELARDGLEQLVGGRRDVERLGVDEHVLDLDAVRVEQVQRCGKRLGRRRDRRQAGGLELLFGIDSRLEHLHHALVELVAEHRILDAAVDVRVVVDLHEHVARRSRS